MQLFLESIIEKKLLIHSWYLSDKEFETEEYFNSNIISVYVLEFFMSIHLYNGYEEWKTKKFHCSQSENSMREFISIWDLMN